jgi:hypothetical protein
MKPGEMVLLMAFWLLNYSLLRDYDAAGCPAGFRAFWKSCDAMIVFAARLRVMGDPTSGRFLAISIHPKMKKSPVIVMLAFAAAFGVAVVARFAGLTLFSELGYTELFGGVFSLSFVGIAFSDYTRRPRFCFSRAKAAAQLPAARAASTMEWTYSTVSV